MIYGASGGIGTALAHALQKEGAKPILLGRNRLKLTALADQLGLEPSRVLFSEHLGQDQARLQKALKPLGPLSIVVHAAGGGLFKPLSQITDSEWDELMQVHLKDAYHLFQLGWPLKAAYQQWVFFGSASCLRPWPKNTLYGAAKAGLAYFCQALEEELRPQGGRVWLFEPGAVDTGFFTQVKSHLPKKKRIHPHNLAAWVVGQLRLPPSLYCLPQTLLSD